MKKKNKSTLRRVRREGPYTIVYYNSGNIARTIYKTTGVETWYITISGRTVGHRVNGPAMISGDGTEMWLLRGKLHREGGPAIIRANGSKEWWKKGKCVTKRYPK